MSAEERRCQICERLQSACQHDYGDGALPHEFIPERKPCTCISCGDCNGSGRVEVSTGDYPEWDLETCAHCQGSGIAEYCAECEMAAEIEETGGTAA